MIGSNPPFKAVIEQQEGLPVGREPCKFQQSLSGYRSSTPEMSWALKQLKLYGFAVRLQAPGKWRKTPKQQPAKWTMTKTDANQSSSDFVAWSSCGFCQVK